MSLSNICFRTWRQVYFRCCYSLSTKPYSTLNQRKFSGTIYGRFPVNTTRWYHYFIILICVFITGISQEESYYIYHALTQFIKFYRLFSSVLRTGWLSVFFLLCSSRVSPASFVRWLWSVNILFLYPYRICLSNKQS